MVSILTSQQRGALSTLLDLNSAMSSTQTRIATGKSINSIFDDPTKFLLAGRLNDRADMLTSVNKQIDLNMSAITAAQKSLTKLKTDFNTAVSDLKTLKGLAETTAAGAYNATDANILGGGKMAAGEVGSATTAGANMNLANTVSPAAIQANKRVFGAAAAAATNAVNGNLGTLAYNAANMDRVRVVINTGGAQGAAFAAGGQNNQLDITAADVGDGSGNLANLTLADVVKKINSQAAGTFGNLGQGNKLNADINAQGQLTFSVVDGTGAAVAQNFRVQVGTAVALTAANAVAADMTAGFGLGNIAGGAAAAQQTVGANKTSTLAPTAAEQATVPPDILNKVLKDGSRAVFDTDANAANNGPGFDKNAGITSGNYGVAQGNTLSVAVKAAGGTAQYLQVTQTDLGTSNTLKNLADVLNAKAVTAGITGFKAAIDQTTGQLSVTAGVGSTIGFGQGATGALANNQADTGGMNGIFGFGANTTINGVAANFAADASGVSLLGTDSASFQDGDTFKIKVTNTSDPTKTREIYFQATQAANVPSSYLGKDGSQTNPYQFNTMQQLTQAISTAFSADQLSASATKVVGTGTGTVATQFQLNLNLKAAYQMEIEQTTNAIGGSAGAPAGADANGVPNTKNAANALEAIFGQRNDTAAGGIKTTIGAETLLTTIDLKDAGNKVIGHEQDYGKKVSYTRVAAAAAQNGDVKRTSVNDNLTRLLNQVAGVVADSQMSGQPNLLAGKALNVNLSEKADRTLTVQLGQGVTTDNLGFAAGSNGQTGYALLQGLGLDTDVDAAIGAFSKAVQSLDAMSYTLASQGANIVSWQSFNKDIASTLTSAATGVTTSDSNADVVEMSALSTRNTYATQSLSMLNQAAQSAGQLLR